MSISNVLVICTGNICRSPMGEALLRRELEGTGIVVHSAGTATQDNEPADPLAVAACAEVGLDISMHRSRMLHESMLAQADLVLAMDNHHRHAILRRWPAYLGKCLVVRPDGVADPLGGTSLDFCKARDTIFLSMLDWAKTIKGMMPIATDGTRQVNTTPPANNPKIIATLLATLGFFGFSGCSLAPGMHYNDRPAKATIVEHQGMRMQVLPLVEAVHHNMQQVQTAQQAQDSAAKLLPAELLLPATQTYTLGVTDVITVVVWEHPELTTPLGQFRSDNAAGQVIGPDGMLYFPYAGLVPAKGLTPTQLRDTLTQRLQTVLKDPKVDIKVSDFRSQRIFISGEVRNAGLVSITDRPLTLADALHRAGGFTPEADMGRVEFVRNGKTHILNLDQCYKQGVSLESVTMLNGDQLRVASRSDRKVYLMGEVGQASAVPMVHGRLTLVQALAEAKGIDRNSAQAEAIYVIRFVPPMQQGSDSVAVRVYHLDARNPLMLAVADQFDLQPRDVVFVAASGLARWNRFVSLILPTASLLSQGLNGAVDIKNLSE